jgi:hypothetical protein
MLIENKNIDKDNISVPFYQKNERDDSLYFGRNRVSSRTSDSPSGEAVSIDSIIGTDGLSASSEGPREVEWKFSRAERIMLFLMNNRYIVSYLTFMITLGVWWQGWLS